MNNIEKKENTFGSNKKINFKKFQNHHTDNKTKKILIITSIIIVLLFSSTFLLINLKKDKKEIDKQEKEQSLEDASPSEKVQIGYVTCDDNASLLNVRNSITGTIIDGLSCYQKVEIDSEIESNGACPKWYKINYQKQNSNYTGYTCATYIKITDKIDKTVENTVKELIDKAIEFNIENNTLAYCGKTNGNKQIEFTLNEKKVTKEYSKSNYKTLEELLKYLNTFLDSNLIPNTITLSDINNPKYNDNYYEIDGNLYCRAYSSEESVNNYTNNYNIEIKTSSDNLIKVNISYEYIKDTTKCTIEDLSKCQLSNLEYKLGKIEIEKINDNYIITKMDFPIK